jgi:hypothetical protein
MKTTAALLSEADKLLNSSNDDKKWDELRELWQKSNQKWRGSYLADSRKMRKLKLKRFSGRRLKSW